MMKNLALPQCSLSVHLMRVIRKLGCNGCRLPFCRLRLLIEIPRRPLSARKGPAFVAIKTLKLCD